jgi:hypothetical protein
VRSFRATRRQYRKDLNLNRKVQAQKIDGFRAVPAVFVTSRINFHSGNRADTGGELSGSATVPATGLIREVESTRESRPAELFAREQAVDLEFATSVRAFVITSVLRFSRFS